MTKTARNTISSEAANIYIAHIRRYPLHLPASPIQRSYPSVENDQLTASLIEIFAQQLFVHAIIDFIPS